MGWRAMISSNDVFTLCVFCAFQFVAFFGLLNMLIGAFCNSAMQIAEAEQMEHDLNSLEKHLMGILECYIDYGQNAVNKTEFDLIVKNTAVNNTLRTCGTDVDALLRISDTIFPKSDSKISL